MNWFMQSLVFSLVFGAIVFCARDALAAPKLEAALRPAAIGLLFLIAAWFLGGGGKIG